MTRLFFRFYLGVIFTLFVAWIIQAYVFRGTTLSANIKVVEDALGGGALSARDDLVDGGEDRFDITLKEVQTRFAYPVSIVKRSDRPTSQVTRGRLDRGEAVLRGNHIVAAIPDTDLLVELGPLPQFAGPTERDILLGLGSVFLLVAGAIAILLRPVVRQLRTVERTALAIADGDLSARIDEGKHRRTLPIANAFNTMANRVETSLRSQKELLQLVSHELRTPLARIKFASELVRSAEDNESREQRIDAIDEATDRLNSLVSELLDYTRYDAGTKEDTQLETLQLDDLVGEAIALHAPLFPEIQFSFSDDSDHIEIHTFRVGLLRAINNLISNAGKYANSQVIVQITRAGDQCLIHVDDDGVGIQPEDRDAVFEPFNRLSNSGPPGNGLGLALVKRICRRLGGDVSVDQSTLGGARFSIHIAIEGPT